MSVALIVLTLFASIALVLVIAFGAVFWILLREIDKAERFDPQDYEPTEHGGKPL